MSRYYNNLCFCNALLANSILNGLSVKLIYKIVFLKNKCLRPFVKIIVNVSNFLTRYRTIVFFKEEKNLSGLLIEKKLSVSKATCPESVFKTVQIILWEAPVIKTFLNVIIILIKENKKKLTLCQRNEQRLYEFGSIQ